LEERIRGKKMHEIDRDAESRARYLAYMMWEAEGRPPGRADEYWYRANERMEAEKQSAYPPVQSRGHRT
jgi:hypothetical protein